MHTAHGYTPSKSSINELNGTDVGLIVLNDRSIIGMQNIDRHKYFETSYLNSRFILDNKCASEHDTNCSHFYALSANRGRSEKFNFGYIPNLLKHDINFSSDIWSFVGLGMEPGDSGGPVIACFPEAGSHLCKLLGVTSMYDNIKVKDVTESLLNSNGYKSIERYVK